MSNRTYSETGYYHSEWRRQSAALQCLSVAFSLLVHISYLGYLEYPLWHPVKAAPPPEHKFIHLVAPSPAQDDPPPPAARSANSPVAPTAVPKQIAAEEKPKQLLVSTPDDSKADASSVKLTYLDANLQLPAILKFYRGYVGFARPDERDQYVRRVFQAGDLTEVTLADHMASLDAFQPILISGSGYSTVDLLRSKYHLEQYLAYALFGDEFDRQLKITLKRAAIARFGGGKIASATVVFSTAALNGIEIADLTIAGASH